MGRIFALDADEIEAVLKRAIVGRIACSGDDGERPYLVPIPFGYDNGSVYSISGPGRKLDIMRARPEVAFEVDEVEAEDRWRSVVADGTFEEVTDPAARCRAIEIVAPQAGAASVAADAIVYRIRLTRTTGRFEVPDDEAHLYE
jgi:nitroimidazol reductase NimA-like FMN-containing flavoprotein (pyridoxamine 5'-phosphate oxidase superfamily)